MKATEPQVNPRRGVVSVEIDGKLRTFKFGMNTLSAYVAMHTDDPGDFADQFEKNPIQALIDMAYCALLVRKAENDLPEDFSPALVGDWIDEMAQVDWELVQKTLLEAMSLGNPNRANLSQAARKK